MKRFLLILSLLCAMLSAALMVWSAHRSLRLRAGILISYGSVVIGESSPDLIVRWMAPLTWNVSWQGFHYVRGTLYDPRLRTSRPIASLRFSLYWPLLPFLIAPALWAFSQCRGREHPAPGLCPHCGYDLRATPDRCPECGKAIPVSAVADTLHEQ